MIDHHFSSSWFWRRMCCFFLFFFFYIFIILPYMCMTVNWARALNKLSILFQHLDQHEIWSKLVKWFQKSKEMMGEEVFPMHVGTPTYPTHPMSRYKVRQDTSSIGSSFPAGAQQGLLSLLVCNRVFFPCWLICHLQFPMETIWPLVIKLRRQSSNDHNCQIWFISLHVKEKMQFNHFPIIISLRDLSLVIATKQNGRSP